MRMRAIFVVIPVLFSALHIVKLGSRSAIKIIEKQGGRTSKQVKMAENVFFLIPKIYLYVGANLSRKMESELSEVDRLRSSDFVY